MSNRPSDVIYMSMPLYHSAALALGMGMALGFGSKTIIRKKFSARNFFKDCALYKVTVSLLKGCLEENATDQLTSWDMRFIASSNSSWGGGMKMIHMQAS